MRTNKIKSINNDAISKRITLLSAFLFASTNVFSQAAQPATATEINSYSNPLFIVFALVIIFLLVMIIVLADVVKGSAKIMMDKQKSKSKMGGIGMLAMFLAFSFSASAQTVTVDAPQTYSGLSEGMFYILTFIVIFEIAVIAAFISIIRSFLGIREINREKELASSKVSAAVPSFIEKLNASVSIESEQEILLDHNYDGIQELDNNLPPWWKYGFYLTIVFAVFYLLHFHVLKTGNLQEAEYTKELAQAAVDIAEYQKKSALSVDENSVKDLVDVESITKGKDIYMNNCVACHGKLGEGQVGPNFTDDYWIHGGSISDLFKTIKYGFPDKGMKAWKDDLSPSQINCVSSYIRTLRGTNPPNQKEKQGDLYVEEGEKQNTITAESKSDSIKIPADSLAITKK